MRVAAQVSVSQLPLRRIPVLSADTPMYDLLRVFQAGHSHMVRPKPPRRNLFLV